jgi:phenylalanyl-tRNA synthetase alpha chain
MSTYLSSAQLDRDLALRDLTDPSAGPHAVQELLGIAVRALTIAWGVPHRSCRGPRVIDTVDNYDNLNFTSDAASRDTRYTRYVDADRMLRSHASAMIPPALRALAQDPVDDVLLVCPGIVYRRDVIDRLHTGTPHQVDLWRISRRPLGDHDMDEMCQLLVDALTPAMPWRSESRVHPYTLNGRQIDVRGPAEWIEVWECGLAHPQVLSKAGLDGCGNVNPIWPHCDGLKWPHPSARCSNSRRTANAVSGRFGSSAGLWDQVVATPFIVVSTRRLG